MRLIISLILIALLPVRSWAGDVMSVQMAAQAVCSSVAAIEPSFTQESIRAYPFAVPPQAASIYASAELALGQKPPIS